MGNSISFKEVCGEYIAAIPEKISTKLGYMSIFEFGDLDKLTEHYVTNQTPVDIRVYDSVKKKFIYDLTYENLKKRKITFLIKSTNKDILNQVVTKIQNLIKWTPLQNKHFLRPRTVIRLSKKQYYQLCRWRNNGLTTLASTEKQANTKIVYLKKKQIAIISSNTDDANRRIIEKLKNYKKRNKAHMV